MSKKVIITISREFGSGGREVGRLLAKTLGIPFYDKKILAELIEKEGISESAIKDVSDHINGAQYYLDMPIKNYVGQGGKMGFLALQERVFTRQEEIIQELAKESCVIVGRCAEHILRNNPNVIRIFVRAEMNQRVDRIRGMYDLSHEQAKAKIKDIDTKRSNYYEYFTNRRWKNFGNFDLLFNTSKITFEHLVEVLITYIEKEGSSN